MFIETIISLIFNALNSLISMKTYKNLLFKFVEEYL